MPRLDRTRRIAEQMKRDLAQAVIHVLDHPKASLLSFTDVRVTRDLSFAKVYFTFVLDDEAMRAQMSALLNQNAPRLRHYLAGQLALRKMPELTFFYDDSVAYGARMDTLLTDLVKDLPPESEE